MQNQGDTTDSRQKPAEPIDFGRLRKRSAIGELRESIRHWAGESRAIRISATRSLNEAEKLRVETKLTDLGWMPHQIKRTLLRARKLNVSEKGLEDLRKGLMGVLLKGLDPQEHPPELPASYAALAHSLHLYRVKELRPRLRDMGLAYGFLRDVPYLSMEKKSFSPPPWHTSKGRFKRLRKEGMGDNYVDPRFSEFEEIVADHSPLDQTAALRTWIQEAGEWKHPGRKTKLEPAGGQLG